MKFYQKLLLVMVFFQIILTGSMEISESILDGGMKTLMENYNEKFKKETERLEDLVGNKDYSMESPANQKELQKKKVNPKSALKSLRSKLLYTPPIIGYYQFYRLEEYKVRHVPEEQRHSILNSLNECIEKEMDDIHPGNTFGQRICHSEEIIAKELWNNLKFNVIKAILTKKDIYVAGNSQERDFLVRQIVVTEFIDIGMELLYDYDIKLGNSRMKKSHENVYKYYLAMKMVQSGIEKVKNDKDENLYQQDIPQINTSLISQLNVFFMIYKQDMDFEKFIHNSYQAITNTNQFLSEHYFMPNYEMGHLPYQCDLLENQYNLEERLASPEEEGCLKAKNKPCIVM